MSKYRCLATRTLTWDYTIEANDEEDARQFIYELAKDGHINNDNAQIGHIEVNDIEADDDNTECDYFCCYECKHRPPQYEQTDGCFDCPRRPYSRGDLNSRDYYDCFEKPSEEDCKRIWSEGKIVWENEDFKVVKCDEMYLVCDNGYGDGLVVSIDDYQADENDDMDFVYFISPWREAEMDGDVDYQLRQLKNGNYETYSEDAWAERKGDNNE